MQKSDRVRDYNDTVIHSAFMNFLTPKQQILKRLGFQNQGVFNKIVNIRAFPSKLLDLVNRLLEELFHSNYYINKPKNIKSYDSWIMSLDKMPMRKEDEEKRNTIRRIIAIILAIEKMEEWTIGVDEKKDLFFILDVQTAEHLYSIRYEMKVVEGELVMCHNNNDYKTIININEDINEDIDKFIEDIILDIDKFTNDQVNLQLSLMYIIMAMETTRKWTIGVDEKNELCITHRELDKEKFIYKNKAEYNINLEEGEFVMWHGDNITRLKNDEKMSELKAKKFLDSVPILPTKFGIPVTPRRISPPRSRDSSSSPSRSESSRKSPIPPPRRSSPPRSQAPKSSRKLWPTVPTAVPTAMPPGPVPTKEEIIKRLEKKGAIFVNQKR